jgi:hypothetical protein
LHIIDKFRILFGHLIQRVLRRLYAF